MCELGVWSWLHFVLRSTASCGPATRQVTLQLAGRGGYRWLGWGSVAVSVQAGRVRGRLRVRYATIDRVDADLQPPPRGVARLVTVPIGVMAPLRRAANSRRDPLTAPEPLTAAANDRLRCVSRS